VEVKTREIICRGGVPLIGRGTVVVKGSSVVSAHSFAVLAEKSHHKLSLRESVFRGKLVPFGCLLIVLRNAQAEHVDPAQLILRFTIALLGSPVQIRKLS
jgi:hypothetical protein